MRTHLIPLLLALSVAIGPQDPVSAPAVGPQVGKPAPTFRLNDHDGRLVAVGGKAEYWTVLAFYPKASTPGCTKEVCSLRDAADQFAAVKTKVYGISLDDVQAQAAFAKAQGAKYQLLSDPDGSAAAKYGALMEGRPVSRRVTFVIDDQGVLRAIDDKVDVSNHGADLAKRIGELQRG